MKRSLPHFDLLHQAKTTCDTVKIMSSSDELGKAIRRIWTACNKLVTVPLGGTCRQQHARTAHVALVESKRHTNDHIARQIKLNALREIAEACNGVEQAQLWARGVHEMRKRDRRPMTQRRVEA